PERPGRSPVRVRYSHGAWADAQESHLDATMLGVVERVVLERGDVEIRAEIMVQAPQHVQVELGGHSLHVIVRALQNGRGLVQVDTDEHPAGIAAQRSDTPQERGCLERLEVADARPGKKCDATAGGSA